MTDRERLKKIETLFKKYRPGYDDPAWFQNEKWLIDTLRECMDEQETVRKQYKLFCRTIREYDKLMLERRKELDVYNKEHPKG